MKICAAIITMTLLILSTEACQERKPRVHPWIGKKAPAFNLKDLSGKEYSSKSLLGKFIVIHFGASWCPFCNAEAPHLEKLWQTYDRKKVQVLYINVMETLEKEKEWVRKYKVTFPVLHDGDGKVSTSYAPEGIQPKLKRHEVPIASNLIIDDKGKIRFYALLDSDDFDAELIGLRKVLDGLIKGPR